MAIHKDVTKCLTEWGENDNRSFAAKILALSGLFLSGTPNDIKQHMRRLASQRIHEAPSTTFELGPKQSKGGAPRVFLYWNSPWGVFLAAGLEKGSTGVAEIGLARQRAKAAEKILKQEDRAQAIEKLKALNFIIFPDPNQGGTNG